jgi:hypothetical protein
MHILDVDSVSLLQAVVARTATISLVFSSSSRIQFSGTLQGLEGSEIVSFAAPLLFGCQAIKPTGTPSLPAMHGFVMCFSVWDSNASCLIATLGLNESQSYSVVVNSTRGNQGHTLSTNGTAINVGLWFLLSFLKQSNC